MRIVEVFLDTLRRLFEHVFGGHAFQLGHGPRRHPGANSMLQVGIESLFGIEFWTVAWQIEQLDAVQPFGYPRFDRLAVTHMKVVQGQEHLAIVRSASLINALRNSISRSVLKASSMIIQRK